MGVIKRQGIKNSIVNFIGVAIGAVSVLFIYPIDRAIYGYTQFLIGTSGFLLSFASLGILSLVVRYFPDFKKQNRNTHQFINLILILYLMAFCLFFVVFNVFHEQIFEFLAWIKVDPENKLADNYLIILLICFFMGLGSIMTSQNSNFKRIVVPDVINSLGIKLFIPCIILLFIFDFISERQVGFGVPLFYGLSFSLLLLYAYYIGAYRIARPRFRSIGKKMWYSMGQYSLFGSLNSIGSMLVFRIDAIMIATMLSFESNGTYFILIYLARITEIPYNAINKIAGPIISDAWQRNDQDNIRTIYRKSSINLLISSIPLFLLIWFSLDVLDSISGQQSLFNAGKYVFLFIALGKVFDQLMSVNNQIIYYSKKYRHFLIFISIMGVSNVLLNYFLIQTFGLIGAAMSSCLTLLIFNLLKYLFIWNNFNMQPLGWPTLKVIVLGVITFLCMYLIPEVFNPYFTIILRGAVLVLVFFPTVYYLRVSEDYNTLVRQLIQRVRN